MTDPAEAAAGRVMRGPPRTLYPDDLRVVAREALEPLRSLHRPVNAHGSGITVCHSCWNALGEYQRWPCASARLIYPEDEL